MGELLYCRDRGRTSCCYHQEKCGGNWVDINNNMEQKAVSFMRDGESFLGRLVRDSGYDSCHRTEGYEVEKCQEDCERRERSSFAKTCQAEGGLYKCCIR